MADDQAASRIDREASARGEQRCVVVEQVRCDTHQPGSDVWVEGDVAARPLVRVSTFDIGALMRRQMLVARLQLAPAELERLRRMKTEIEIIDQFSFAKKRDDS